MFASLTLLSVLCASTLLIVNFVDFHSWVRFSYEFQAAEFAAAGLSNYYDLVRWHWAFSPLFASWGFPLHDAFLLPHAWRTPGLVLSLHAVFALGLCASLNGLRRALSNSSSEPSPPRAK